MIKLFIVTNATCQVTLPLTAIARKRCKVTNYLADIQVYKEFFEYFMAVVAFLFTFDA